MARKVPPMQDMSLSNKEALESFNPSPPRYPFGLSISLCEDELDKLKLSDENLEPGDMIHLHCMATVTSISKNSNQDGDHCRVELQITHIATEDEEEEDEKASGPSKLYKR